LTQLFAVELVDRGGEVLLADFALDLHRDMPKTTHGLATATYELFAGMIEFGLSRQLTEIVTVTDARMERILRRAGWPLGRVGKPCALGSTLAVAGYLETSVAKPGARPQRRRASGSSVVGTRHAGCGLEGAILNRARRVFGMNVNSESKNALLRSRAAKIDLQHLHYAIAAADHGSFRRAAEALLLRQSTLSRCIRQLEEAIGVIVFDRSSGGVDARGRSVLSGKRPHGRTSRASG